MYACVRACIHACVFPSTCLHKVEIHETLICILTNGSSYPKMHPVAQLEEHIIVLTETDSGENGLRNSA